MTESLSRTEKIDFLENFAKKHEAEFKFGEIGFGRECVGILRGTSWMGYNLNHEEEGDMRLIDFIAEHAYHKDNYVAVLLYDITIDVAIEELYHWCKRLDEQGVSTRLYHSPHPSIGSLLGRPSGEWEFFIP